MKPKINFTQSQIAMDALEIKMGRITAVEAIKKSSNSKLTVAFDEERSDVRTVVTSMENAGDLLDKLYPFVTNLEPVEKKKILSEAMIIPPLDENGNPTLRNLRAGDTLL